MPNSQQHTDLQKLNLNVSKLKDVTNEALSGWFTDKDNPNNALKKPKLDEIFKVAAQEERYRHGQIGKLTCSMGATALFTNRFQAPRPKSM